MKVLDTKLDGYRRAKVIKSAMVKDFSGGLDLSDDDLNLTSKYAKVLTNMYRSRDGRLRLRYGYRQLADMPAGSSGNVLRAEYYGGSLIVATTNGEIVRFPLASITTPVVLWPTGGKSWSSGLTVVNFAQAQGELLIVNGKDKPLRLKKDFSIDWLGDVGNANSNANTPITPFITTCNNFVVMGGAAATPSKLYFSAQYSTGTFSGDPAPNDATTFDVGGAIAHGDNVIVGLASLNNYLFVAFETSTIVVAVGGYGGTVHQPIISDVFDTYGAISQRSMVVVDRELWYCDQTGVLKMARNQLGTAFIPDRMSHAVDPALLKHLWYARNAGQAGNTIAIYNRVASQYWIFVPNDSGYGKYAWVSTRYAPDDPPSWSFYTGLNITAAVISSIGRMYFFTPRKLFVYGDVNNEYFDDNAAPIPFDWETPWSVFQSHDNIKKMKAIRIYTRGTAQFKFELFVDGIYKDRSSNYDPTAWINFVAGDALAFGLETGDDPYGGGRITSDPRIWKWDGKFIQGKFRMSGATTKDLQVVGISVAYTVGGRKRI